MMELKKQVLSAYSRIWAHGQIAQSQLNQICFLTGPTHKCQSSEVLLQAISVILVLEITKQLVGIVNFNQLSWLILADQLHFLKQK